MTDISFSDAADPSKPSYLDKYIVEYIGKGYTDAEVVDALVHWRRMFPGGPSLAADRLLTIRVAAIRGQLPKRDRGRPKWTADEMQWHWDEALSHGKLPRGASIERVAPNFMQLNRQDRGVAVETLRDLLDRFPETRR